MKNIYIYSKSQGEFAAFYLEGRSGQYQAGVIKGTSEAALLTGLISFFASRGPENTLVYGHSEQRVLFEDLTNLYDNPEKVVKQMADTSDSNLWRRLKDTIKKFNFLITYHTETKEEPETERLKFYVQRMLENRTKNKG